jgi:hypothetical protein
MEVSKTALIRSIQRSLNEVYAHDQVKPVCVPFASLGKEIVEKIPGLDGRILVLSDLGLLVAVWVRKRDADITFVAHTNEQAEFARQVGVTKILQVGYNDPVKELEKQLMGLKFDVIVGNPPYQKERWVDFVQTALNNCKQDGYVCMITPTNWVFSYHKAHKMIFANEVVIACNDVTSSFPAIAESIGWFLLKKTIRISDKIPILGKDGAQYVFQPGQFMVARGLNAVTNDILRKFNTLVKRECFKSNCKVNALREVADDEFRWPVINHIWGTKYTNIPPSHPGQMKVFLSRTLVRRGGQRTMKAHVDLGGEMRHLDGFYFLVESEQEALDLEWLIQESRLMRFISGQVDKSQYLSPELRMNIPHLSSPVRTDDELAEYCGLEDAEREYLARLVK